MNFWGFSCVSCGRRLNLSTTGLCSDCQKQIRKFTYCISCGRELSRSSQFCGRCLQQKPNWDQMVIISTYNEPLSTLIHRFKFQQAFWLDRYLARLLLLAIRQARTSYALPWPEVILPVPLHHLRQWQRGYNQADLIAKQLARWLRIPCVNQLLIRHKHTHSQRGLSAQERYHNLAKAFGVNQSISFPYQSVALVDDVITTGTTVNEIAQLLRHYGVKHIQVWGLARVKLQSG